MHMLLLLLLRRPQLSIATAIVFYHRFYAQESYEKYERFQVPVTPVMSPALPPSPRPHYSHPRQHGALSSRWRV
jgi:hypothetical protein